MSPARTITGRGARSWRAATAVIALYALVLQALLGGIAALPGTGPFGTLCLQTADGTPAPEQPREAGHHAGACCTAPQAAATTEPPAEASAVVWPRRVFVRLAWRIEGIALARASPGTVASARAPPVV